MSTRALDLAAPVAVALAAGRRDGIHGDAHWRRVGEAGLFLAEREGVSAHVVLLFAIFHDCRRENDVHDPGHGPRAAALAEQIGHEPLGLSVDELATLAHAMREHDRGRVTRDRLVGACWDADRLDLHRVGITPDPRLLSTGTARDGHTIARFADFQREPVTWEALGTTQEGLRRGAHSGTAPCRGVREQAAPTAAAWR